MRSERGSASLWMLGLSVLLLAFGGLAVDLWRALAMQRELAAVADSTAIAAAAGIDEVLYRDTGVLAVDSTRAWALGSAYALSQEADLIDMDIVTSADGSEVSVIMVGELELGLMGLFVGDEAPLTVRATATASPMLVP
jgi:Putative Flp pilus-assembly TadE/G-like